MNTPLEHVSVHEQVIEQTGRPWQKQKIPLLKSESDLNPKEMLRKNPQRVFETRHPSNTSELGQLHQNHFLEVTAAEKKVQLTLSSRTVNVKQATSLNAEELTNIMI